MPAPRTAEQAVNELLKRFSELDTRLGSVGNFIGDLAHSFRTLAELSHRLAFQMAAMVGAPRFLKGGLHYALTGSHGRLTERPKASATAAAVGVDGEKKPFPTFEERVEEMRKLHAERMRLTDEEKSKQDAFFLQAKLARRAEDEERRQARRRDREEDRAAWLEAQKHARGFAEAVGLGGGSAKSDAPGVAPEPSGKGPGAGGVPKAVAGEPATGAATPEERREFRQQARTARQFVRAHYGVPDALLPRHNPKNAEYRRWVAEMGRQAGEPGNAGPTVEAARAAAAGVKPAATPLSPGRWAAAMDRLSAASQTLTRSFLGAASVAQGLVQAASPDAWATFTGSIQLLAAQVGGTLVPFFAQLSLAVQETARWFDALTPGTKGLVGGVLKWGLVIGGTLAAAAALGVALAALVTPLSIVAVTAGAVVVALAELLRRLKGEKSTDEKSDKEIAGSPAVTGLEDDETLEKAHARSKRFRSAAEDAEGEAVRLRRSGNEKDARHNEENARFFRGRQQDLDAWIYRKEGVPGGDLLKSADVQDMLREAEDRGVRTDSQEFHDLVRRRKENTEEEAKRLHEYNAFAQYPEAKMAQLKEEKAARLGEYLKRLTRKEGAGDLINTDEVQDSLAQAGRHGVKTDSEEYYRLVQDRQASLNDQAQRRRRAAGSAAPQDRPAAQGKELDAAAEKLKRFLDTLGAPNPGAMTSAERKELADMEQTVEVGDVHDAMEALKKKGPVTVDEAGLAKEKAGAARTAAAVARTSGIPADALERSAGVYSRYAELRAKAGGGANNKVKYEEAVSAGGARHNLLPAYANRGTPQYMAVENAYKRTQLAALGDDPLTAEIKRIQNESLKKLVENSDSNKGLLEDLISLVKLRF